MNPQDILLIDEDGNLNFVYSDDLRPLLDLGRAAIRRASHVEPTPDAQWIADLSPVGGPALGPFSLRKDAVKAERLWLNTHHLT